MLSELQFRRLVTTGRSVYNVAMTKGILVAGNDSALLNAVETEVAKRVAQYALALIPNRFSVPRENPSYTMSSMSQSKSRVPLDWNPGSAISARTLVLAAENRLGVIDGAILVCSPPSAPCAAADLKPVDIEVLASDHVKSWLFLTKELAAGFKARGQGTLALVYPETDGDVDDGDAVDIFGAMAAASFRSLARRLSAAASSEAYVVQGFTGGGAGNEAEFAGFIFRQLDDAKRRVNGKIHKYGKTGFFK